MIGDKEPDERDQISEFDEKKWLKIYKYWNLKIEFTGENLSDEMNLVNMSDNKDSDEREQISKNDEVKVSDGIEDLKW